LKEKDSGASEAQLQATKVTLDIGEYKF
jgi:hypothetical protein